ncbi:MAG TPA: AlkA N-terminal domain-containing protein [Acetobacteraceae bacterium]|nr:AlkA N-terminal domain-containing protein [Acetobacteraceae bacterium]
MHLDRESCYRALLARDPRFDGQFFTAVRTTGIYCRPICPARPPKLEHVIFMPSAAAAQAAGFRPCLRCRPETSPETAAWRGTYNTVSRALALIAAGALNENVVEELAGRLGVGARQLRRLFQKHLGASPKAVAGTRRVLFAKRLITDTALPMADVALAAGFGSVRRFNDTFLKLYGRPPSGLRHAGKEAAQSSVRLTLPFKPPYDWSSLIFFLAARAIPGVERVSADAYARSITLGEMKGTILVRPALERNCLIATIRFPAITALPLIVERIRRLFDLGAEPGLIGAHLSSDPGMAARVRARPGLRVPGAWDGFELGVRAILGQQISVGAATALAGRLVVAYGDALPPPEDASLTGLTHAFPPPRRIAEAPDLAATLGMPRARAASLIALAEAAATDPHLFEPGKGLEASIARLRALPGIGAWTAQYIAMRALREPDAFPASDLGLLRAASEPDGQPTPVRLLARAQAWRPWRAYAALHLWASDPVAARRKQEETRGFLARTHGLADRDDSARL